MENEPTTLYTIEMMLGQLCTYQSRPIETYVITA